MGLNIVRLKSSNDIYLLADGLTFKVVSESQGNTDTITEENSKHIISVLNNGIEVEKIIRRIRAGEKLDTIDKTISMSMQGKKYSSSNFLIFNVVVNDVDRATWTGSILRDEGTIYLRAGVIKDILEYLVSIGIKEKPKPYYYIEYVAKLPLTDRTDIAWILTADDGDKPAGTVWRWNSSTWVPVYDAIDEHFSPDRDCCDGGGGGGNFIISVEEPEDLEPGDVWGRIDP